MSEKSKNKKGQSKGEKPHKGNDRNAKGDSKDQKKTTRDRDAHNVTKQDPKLVQPTPAVNKVEVPETDTVAPFANLKRETDEILKITEGVNKFAKREIRSNWTKYELPADNYEIVEKNSHGADFNELLQMAVSRGGHFQFKHEKTWGSNKKSSQYSDLFTLDLKYISSALMCVPFHERNRLDPSLFSAEQVSRMTSTANKNMTKFQKNLPIEKKENELSRNIMKKLTGKDTDSNAMPKTVCEIVTKEKNVINEDSDDEIVEEVSDVEDILKHPIKCDAKPSDEQLEDDKTKASDFDTLEKIANVTIFDEDDELDEILGMTNTKLDQIQGTTAVKKSPEMINIPIQPSNPLASNEVDLDKWLDEYLDSDT